MKSLKKLTTLLLCLVMAAGMFTAIFPAAAHADDIIFCPQCGKKIDAGSRFCMYCGHEIKPVAQQSTPQSSTASTGGNTAKTASPYIIGSSENTFAGLYKRMCVNLDLKKNPIPTPDEDFGSIGSETLYAKVLKDDAESYEYIGYCRGANGINHYICWSWEGYHADGSVIEMMVFYTTDGKYLGNIQFDRTAGTSTSSHNSPYFVPGEPLNKA